MTYFEDTGKKWIELGDKVRCKYSGFEGIAVAKTIFINGCVQYLVLPRWNKVKDGLIQEQSIDSQSLEVIEKRKKPKEKEKTGGATKRGYQIKNYKQRGY